MKSEIFELRLEKSQLPVTLSVVRLDMHSILLELLDRIPRSYVAQCVRATFTEGPGPRNEEELEDRILMVEGDLAGLALRSRFGGDGPRSLSDFVKELARESQDFYQTVEGQVRLDRIKAEVLGLNEPD
ncbi:MAG: hypothetical protein KDK33_16345 [Leptospiraceae bacterium]|nr:hypothetical protein [Leptospiraceae bacterium]